MQHGMAAVGDGRFTVNVRAMLKQNAHRGSVLVRGFRLYHITLKAGEWGSSTDWSGNNAWKAVFHLVVAHPPEGGGSKYIYEDPNLPVDEEDVGLDYIFVPSSRGHAELGDEDVLSNKWALGYVVGGNAHFSEMVVLDQRLRGRRRSVLGTTPEQVVAKRSQKCYLMPEFAAWHSLNEISDPLDCVAELFGFPVVDIDDFLNLEDFAAVKEAMAKNEDALVDGLETLTLHVKISDRSKRGRVTMSQLRKVFRRHYDDHHRRVEKKQAELMDMELARMGYIGRGSGQGAY